MILAIVGTSSPATRGLVPQLLDYWQPERVLIRALHGLGKVVKQQCDERSIELVKYWIDMRRFGARGIELAADQMAVHGKPDMVCALRPIVWDYKWMRFMRQHGIPCIVAAFGPGQRPHVDWQPVEACDSYARMA